MLRLQFVAVLIWSVRVIAAEPAILLDVASTHVLEIPELSSGAPEAGKRVKVTPPEYAGTQVFHTVYLPAEWHAGGSKWPIIFEYTGNYFPASGSTGEPEDAALGYCLSAGRYIWVSLPYIAEGREDNAVTWWGDEKATVDYAKRNVPRIIRAFNADERHVVLCGFSRGAIGVNYIGLNDDEIAKLWTAFVAHDHFDGEREWSKTSWGTPQARYRAEAIERLRRVRGRPYFVSQHGTRYQTDAFIRDALPDSDGFTFCVIDAKQILGAFPNRFAKSSHTDRWLVKPSDYRRKAWSWMNAVAAGVDVQVDAPPRRSKTKPDASDAISTSSK